MPEIILKNVRKEFGNKFVAVDNLNMVIEDRSFITLLGPSGCGKTTTLRMIAGLETPTSGQIIIDGVTVFDAEKGINVPPDKRDVGFLFQNYALWPHMTVYKNIAFGLENLKWPKDKIAERVEELLKMLKIEQFGSRYPSELSGGQQQRVAIARALITKPAIILLDEPLCNLDVQLRIEMRTEMAQLFRHLKTTVFHVTHDPSEAFAMADRIIVMNQGNIDQNGKPEECYKMPKTAVVAGLLGAGNRLDGTMLSERDEDRVQIRTAGIVVWCMNFIGKKECGTVAELRFRPEDGRFCEETGSQRIPVQVQMSSFEGGQYRVRVCTEQNQSFCLLHPEFLPEGMKGFVEIPAERLYAYEKISG